MLENRESTARGSEVLVVGAQTKLRNGNGCRKDHSKIEESMDEEREI